MELLRRQQGEALAEIKAHLIAEGTDRACTCTVSFVMPFTQDMAEQV